MKDSIHDAFTVLIVDDDPLYRIVLSRIARRAGVNTCCFGDLHQAKEVLERRHRACIFQEIYLQPTDLGLRYGHRRRTGVTAK